MRTSLTGPEPYHDERDLIISKAIQQRKRYGSLIKAGIAQSVAKSQPLTTYLCHMGLSCTGDKTKKQK